MPEFKARVAMNARVYGSVTIEANTLEEAGKLIDAQYVSDNFTPHGGNNDIDYSHPSAIWVECVQDEDADDDADSLTEFDVPDGPWMRHSAVSHVESQSPAEQRIIDQMTAMAYMPQFSDISGVSLPDPDIQKMPKRQVRFECQYCLEDVYFDTTAYWDADMQCYRFSDDFNSNYAYCGDCGGEDCLKVVDITTGDVLGLSTDQETWIPLDQAKAERDTQQKAYDHKFANLTAHKESQS
jgi:hypothetical protein